ncbi:MAG: hypothetical protein JXJ04_05680 [Spirochaetales bacterium]|nr:hypothetical protein [Spirochaetales bacterium]
MTGANYYLEISFDSGVGSLAPGQQTDAIQLRIRKLNWTNYTQTGDYSFNPAMTSFTLNTNVTGYIEDSRVFGNLPQ